jgi:2-methylcitrate dehydratase PrpD
VATAAFDKDVFLNSYTPEARARQDVRELMTRISARQDPDLPSFGVRVNTSLKDGRQFSKDCPYSKGQPMKPFTEQELVKRFKKCVPYAACKLDDAAVDSVIKAILDLENNEDVMGSLLVPLTPK